LWRRLDDGTGMELILHGLLAQLYSTGGAIVHDVVPFLFVLMVVVFVHEMGHYLVGRWCGIGVKAFSVGFGPEIVGFTDRTGTRWKLSAIPLGGYVRFVGDEDAAGTPSGETAETLTDAESAVAFANQSVGKRAATVFAGPAFNILLTMIVFSVFLGIYGRMVADPMVAQVRPGSPAAEAGFQPGDRFLGVDGNSVSTFSDVQRYVSLRAGEPIHFKMERDGRSIDLVATPRLEEETDPLGNKVKMGVVGVINNESVGNFRRIRYGPLEAMGEGAKETGSIILRTGQFFRGLVAGREDRCQLGGPVKIATMAGQAASLGFSWLVQLTAMLSIGIGLLNLLPLPPLDGGHLFFYLIEAVRRRPVPLGVQEAFFRAGAFIVFCFMAFALWNDLFAC
jgi:regulator of sigma E protease